MDALRGALVTKPITVPVRAPPLPPIPVGVPTVQRSDISLNSFTKREDVLTALKQYTAASKPDPAGAPASRRRVSRTLLYILLFLALFALSFKFAPTLLTMIAPPTETITLPVTEVAMIPTDVQSSIENTQTPVPPTFTETAIPPSVTPSQTALSVPTATSTMTATANVTATPTSLTPSVKYPDGHLMTAFYNASSFYMLDRGKASRSVAGFSFDRVNTDGTFQNHFSGWEWEKYYDVIKPTRCISLELFPAPVPYLAQAECANRVLSNLRFAPTGASVFWTPDDTSLEFRVLWLEEEVARCNIEAGTCDIYVP